MTDTTDWYQVVERHNPYPDDDDVLWCDVCGQNKGTFRGRKTWFNVVAQAQPSLLLGAVCCDDCAQRDDVKVKPYPKVINLKDTGGVLPEGAVYVGRAMPRYGLPGSRFANPFKVGGDGTRDEVLWKYAEHFAYNSLWHELDELRGRDLACWCAPEPCHADLLLIAANTSKPGG